MNHLFPSGHHSVRKGDLKEQMGRRGSPKHEALNWKKDQVKRDQDLPSRLAARGYLDELTGLIGEETANQFLQSIPEGATPQEICGRLRVKVNQVNCEQGNHEAVGGMNGKMTCRHCGTSMGDLTNG
jgi:hypothetical protein